MKKKNIAFVVNSLYGGGAEKVLQVFLAHFDRRRYDITLINHREENVDNKLYPSDIKYKNILKSAENRKTKIGLLWVKIYNKINLFIYDNFSSRVFRSIYLRDKFDVEIAFIEGYATKVVSGGQSRKKIAWVHSDLKLCPWTDIAFRSKEEQIKCYSFFDKVISVSKSIKESVEELFFCKSLVVYNPINPEEIQKMSLQFKVERDKKRLLFVSVGRLVLPKGYDRLIPIVGKLVAEGFDFRLWIVGEGTERRYLEDLISEWKLERFVKLWGYQNNPYPYIKASDWFVCSSRNEGYSTVVNEAVILQRPVITTHCSGMQELLGENNEYGIIVENEEESLLNGMRDILKDQKLTKRYTDLSVGESRFSLAHQMDNIYNVIDT